MIVAVDTNPVFFSNAGMRRYVSDLVRALRKRTEPALEIRELAWPVLNLEYRQPFRAAKTIYREWIWSHVAAPVVLQKMKADIVHRCSASPIAHPNSTKEIVTLYDLAVLRHPERYRKWHRFSEPRRLRTLHRADGIVCISRFTADEAVNLLGIPASKIEVIYPGTDFEAEGGRISEKQPAMELPDRFFLFVGSLEPGKNLDLLRGAYDLALSRGIPLPPLIVVGARWAGVPREGNPPPSWRYAGRLSDEELLWLYRRSIALLFPSKYEGFGLPVLEAMSIGCPVLCSKVASLPEVGGDAVMYAGLTPHDWLESMILLNREDKLREDLKRAGLSRASCFTWDNCAKNMIELYNRITK